MFKVLVYLHFYNVRYMEEAKCDVKSYNLQDSTGRQYIRRDQNELGHIEFT